MLKLIREYLTEILWLRKTIITTQRFPYTMTVRNRYTYPTVLGAVLTTLMV